MNRRCTWVVVVVAAAGLACASSVPSSHFYRLQLPAARSVAPAACQPRASLIVQDLQVVGAYDDTRIVYRESEYQLQRYEYHEWAAPPGEMVSDVLRDGFAASGMFERVGRVYDASADASLRGRVTALEEVDLGPTRWVGHLRLELELRDAKTKARLWSRDFDVTHPMRERSPSGLAAAASAMLREVIDASSPAMAAAIPGPCAQSGVQADTRQRGRDARWERLAAVGYVCREAHRCPRSPGSVPRSRSRSSRRSSPPRLRTTAPRRVRRSS
jgi:uncharacterized lipoprotein YmbA